MKFSIGNRELEFNIRTKEIIYKNKVFQPSVRTYQDMKELYKEGDNVIKDDFGLYYMYRDVYMSDEDKKIFKKKNFRYDITIILPKIIGNEYNKTFGHFHPMKKNTKKYEEIYEVLSGDAIYLQQNNKEVFYTNCISGDKIVMQESFGHITINPSTTDFLIMSNIVDSTFKSEYITYKELKGGNYFYTNSFWEINKKYNNNLEIKEDCQKYDGIINIYDDFLLNPDKFNFLH